SLPSAAMKRLHRRLTVAVVAVVAAGAAVFGVHLAYADTYIDLITFTNVNSNKCLEIGYYSTANYPTANQYTCLNGPNQQRGPGWRGDVGNVLYGEMESYNSRKCLAVGAGAGGAANFAAVYQVTCNASTSDGSQLWQLVPPTCNVYSYCRTGEMLK